MGEKRFYEAWCSFEQAILPPSFSDIQRTEMRRAFYAGGIALFEALVGNVGDNPDEPLTPAEISVMEDLSTELEEWKEMMARGEV